MGAPNSKASQSNDDNLETFSILWLDAQINSTADNRQTQQRLRQTINHLKTFDSQEQCHKHILSISAQDRIVLIVSGRCGQQLVPQIHQLRQISSIYVYCIDKARNEQWAKNFTKVKSVIVKLDDLVKQIKENQENLAKIEEPISISIFKTKDNPDKSTTGLNGHFVHSLLLIDALTRMKSIESDKQQLIKICKKEYQNNSDQLELVHEFENEYSAADALWWYTRNSFLHRMLNKALREQNIDLLFLFRFVIGDIYQQLKRNQCPSSVTVYRGQLMSNDELNTLRQSTSELISISSFFSTTLSRQMALKFLSQSGNSNDLHRVLFVIDADSDVVKTKPFADISSFSDFSKEMEVLFMIGCVFRLINIARDNNGQIWVIQMRLCGDDEHDLKKLFDHMKKEYGGGNNEVTLLSLGNVLRQMGKYDLAEKMYNRALDELSLNDSSLFDLYWSLGLLTKDKGDYDSSLEWFDKSLKFRLRTNRSDYVNIANLYNSIGEVHRLHGNQTRALKYYELAIELFQKEHNENDISMAYFYNNIAIIYDDKKDYSEALDYYRKSLAIKKQHLSFDHPSIAMSYNNIGCVHYNRRQYDPAIEQYQRSLEINLKTLPSQHPDIAVCYKNIGLVYEKSEEWKQALKYYQQAATIYVDSFSSQHPDVVQIKKDIERVSLKLK